MRRFARLCTFALLALFTFAADQVLAQDSELFSGNGLSNKSGWGLSRIGENNPSALGNTRQEATALPKFKFPELKLPQFKAPDWEMPKLFRGDQFPEAIQLSDSGQGLFSGLPKFDQIFPPRDPNRPNFFQRMNERTKEIFGRTRENFSSLAQDAEGATRDSWDSITRGLNGDIGGSGNRNQPPIQPNLRTARQVDGSTTKF